LARLALSDRRGVLSSSGIASLQSRSPADDQCTADLPTTAIPCERRACRNTSMVPVLCGKAHNPHARMQ